MGRGKGLGGGHVRVGGYGEGCFRRWMGDMLICSFVYLFIFILSGLLLVCVSIT